MDRLKIKNLILLHIILLIYSFVGVFSKLASYEQLFSLKFILYYSGIIFILLLYALFWQQILKNIPLTTAVANKAITIIWGMIWGAIIFREKIKIQMIVGAVLIFYGIYLVVKYNE